MNGIFKLSWINIKSALVYGALSAVLAMATYAINVNDLFQINWHTLLNAGVFGFLIVLVSLIKNILTNDEGNFVGLIKVIPPTK